MSKAQNPVMQHVSYWMGITLSIFCLALIFAGNTTTLPRLADIPVAWLLGILAIGAFLGAEYFGSADATATDIEVVLEPLQTEA